MIDAGLVIAGLLAGVFVGHMAAVLRTDRLLAHMTAEELAALAARVRRRRR